MGYSTRMGEGATTAASDPERFFDVVRAAVQALDHAVIPHAVIGSAAHVAYVGECPIENLDVLVKPVDADRVLTVLDHAGFRNDRTLGGCTRRGWMASSSM